MWDHANVLTWCWGKPKKKKKKSTIKDPEAAAALKDWDEFEKQLEVKRAQEAKAAKKLKQQTQKAAANGQSQVSV